MSVNLSDQRNVALLTILVVATIVVAGTGIMWLRGAGYALIEEISYLLLVIIVALFAYDRLLVQ